ncbi:hypothetical protein M0811_07929 [Anaeramoeba ignava]|uniref:Uncharacterized protein n=1 Tax=Anaeramoeba ignava TaxID=1746090 RepID=A0A9Q0LK11_ANAIG|nr:hypothetical protein M0811_07929 [Anaeramoeba ignava]
MIFQDNFKHFFLISSRNLTTFPAPTPIVPSFPKQKVLIICSIEFHPSKNLIAENFICVKRDNFYSQHSSQDPQVFRTILVLNSVRFCSVSSKNLPFSQSIVAGSYS